MVSQGLSLSVLVGGVFHSILRIICSQICAFLPQLCCPAPQPWDVDLGSRSWGSQCWRPQIFPTAEHPSSLLGFPSRRGKDLTRLYKYSMWDKGRCCGSDMPIAWQKKSSSTALFKKGEIQIVDTPYEQGHWAICPFLHIGICEGFMLGIYKTII